MRSALAARFRRAIGRAARSLGLDQRGATAVEFSLIALPLFMLSIGTIQFGHAYWVKSLLQFAVEEAGRYAMVNTSATTTQVAAVASAKLTGYGLTSANLTVAAATSTSGGVNYMSVTAQYTYSFLSHLIPVTTLTLRSQSKVPLTL